MMMRVVRSCRAWVRVNRGHASTIGTMTVMAGVRQGSAMMAMLVTTIVDFGIAD